jgi:hypothetical protein
MKEPLDDITRTRISTIPPVYIEMIRQWHHDRYNVSTSEENKNSVLYQGKYPIALYVFISQSWTNLGCEGILYPNGFHIPIINITLKVGVIENMYLY